MTTRQIPKATIGLLAVAALFFACNTATDDAGGGGTAALGDGATAKTAPPSDDTTVTFEGIDVSHFQGDVDWTQVKAAGKTFAFAKATQGTEEVDPQFATNWPAMKQAGVVRGAYHFFQPDADATAQAEHFIATVQLEAGDLPPVIDVEVAEGVSTEGIDADVKTWLEKVAAAYGVQPILYSDLSFIQENLASGFSDYPLWVADYSSDPPDPPGDWQKWTFWQNSDTGEVAGIDGDVDLDRYQGTEAEWRGLLVAAP